MRIGFIFVLYNTPKKEVWRLKKEVKDLKLNDYSIYFIDNSFNKKGYGYGVNQGIKKAIKDNCQLFFIANPDISIKSFKNKNFLEVFNYFDVCGYGCKQENFVFYGGEIDRWRLSGGLIKNKPKKRFQSVDFPSGSLIGIKKTVVDKIGLFDESYFMYYEEVDFCYRAKKAGFKIGIDSDLIYNHFEISKYNLLKEKWLFLSHYRFFFRYSNIVQKIREFLRLPKTIYEQIKKRSFYLNFFSLNLFSLINKFLSFLVFLILINNFNPDSYGVYTLAWAHISLFMPILDFGTTVYGLVNISLNHKKNLKLLINLRLFLGFFSFLINNVFAFFIYFKTKEILYPILLLSIVFLVNSLSGSYLIYVSIKQKSYSQGLINLIFQLILTISTFLILLINKDLISLFYLYFLIYFGLGIFYLYLLIKETKLVLFNVNLNWYYKVIKSSFIFLLINLLANWYAKLDIFLLNFLKNRFYVGIYSSASKFLDALLFIATAYNISSIPIYASFINNKDFKNLKEKIKKDILLLSFIGLFISIFIIFFGKIIFLMIKKEYFLALPVLNIIIFNLPLILISSIAINIIYSFKKEFYVVIVFVAGLLVNGFLNWIYIPKFGIYASALISLLGWILNTTIFWLIVVFLIKNNKDKVLKISVDGGSLDSKNYFGTKTFAENFIKTLLTIDNKNQYIIYRLNKNKFFNFLWLKVQLSFRELLNRKDLYLGLNQAIPSYVSGKIISFCHGLSYYFYPNFYNQKILKKLKHQLNEMINKSDKIIVSSEKIKKELVKINKSIINKIITIPFGIPLDLLSFLKNKKLNKKRKKFFLVVVGSEKIKNINFIKKVFLKIKKISKFKNFKLILINNQNDRKKLFKYYLKAYCLLTSSYYESFNFPVLEALVCGCPVIALKTAVIPELAKYVNIAENDEEFINLIKNTKVKPNKKIINQLKNQFSWENFAKKIIKLYKEI